MKLICPTNLLQKSLNLVEVAISSRTPLAILNHVYISLKNNVLTLRGSDLEVSVEHQTDIEGNLEDGEILIKAATLNSILSKLDSNSSVELTQKTQRIRLESGSVGFDLLAQEAENYPEFPEIEQGDAFTLPVSVLQDLIRHTLFCVSNDLTKDHLNGILFEIKDDNLTLIATDGFRLAIKKVSISVPNIEKNVLIPHKGISELFKVLQHLEQDAEIEIILSKTQASFKMGGFLLITRILQGDFPDYKQIIPQETRLIYTLPRRRLIQASERASIIAQHTDDVVCFSFSDQLEIKSQSSQMGEFKETLSYKPSEKSVLASSSINLVFNIKLVLEAIKVMGGDEVNLLFNDECTPCIFMPSNYSDYICVIMPIRTSEFEFTPEENVFSTENDSV